MPRLLVSLILFRLGRVDGRVLLVRLRALDRCVEKVYVCTCLSALGSWLIQYRSNFLLTVLSHSSSSTFCSWYKAFKMLSPHLNRSHRLWTRSWSLLLRVSKLLLQVRTRVHGLSRSIKIGVRRKRCSRREGSDWHTCSQHSALKHHDKPFLVARLVI